ncbi:cancer-related nucleoside-triphosphatase isoform X2 [Zalophus californianus]|uniref:Cancer-related nucleoside-triphosphatase isoform X2 n=1 Tax=Zalophus californianus TaxID=9704 RepID=A0A6J2D8M6_ZALCA|nr:cancer-related nucleoside-triphosphatase isoform X2 [Zalophus californianus]
MRGRKGGASGRRRRGLGHGQGLNPRRDPRPGLTGMARHVFLTGPPGVGKTTLIQKASEVLKSSGVPVDGFYTEEVRQGGRRIGFDVVTLSGMRGVLSRIGSEPPPGKRECRVGQYVVDLTSFEHLALPVLRNVRALQGLIRTSLRPALRRTGEVPDPFSDLGPGAVRLRLYQLRREFGTT